MNAAAIQAQAGSRTHNNQRYLDQTNSSSLNYKPQAFESGNRLVGVGYGLHPEQSHLVGGMNHLHQTGYHQHQFPENVNRQFVSHYDMGSNHRMNNIWPHDHQTSSVYTNISYHHQHPSSSYGHILQGNQCNWTTRNMTTRQENSSSNVAIHKQTNRFDLQPNERDTTSYLISSNPTSKRRLTVDNNQSTTIYNQSATAASYTNGPPATQQHNYTSYPATYLSGSPASNNLTCPLTNGDPFSPTSAIPLEHFPPTPYSEDLHSPNSEHSGYNTSSPRSVQMTSSHDEQQQQQFDQSNHQNVCLNDYDSQRTSNEGDKSSFHHPSSFESGREEDGGYFEDGNIYNDIPLHDLIGTVSQSEVMEEFCSEQIDQDVDNPGNQDPNDAKQSQVEGRWATTTTTTHPQLHKKSKFEEKNSRCESAPYLPSATARRAEEMLSTLGESMDLTAVKEKPKRKDKKSEKVKENEELLQQSETQKEELDERTCDNNNSQVFMETRKRKINYEDVSNELEKLSVELSDILGGPHLGYPFTPGLTPKMIRLEFDADDRRAKMSEGSSCKEITPDIDEITSSAASSNENDTAIVPESREPSSHQKEIQPKIVEKEESARVGGQKAEPVSPKIHRCRKRWRCSRKRLRHKCRRHLRHQCRHSHSTLKENEENLDKDEETELILDEHQLLEDMKRHLEKFLRLFDNHEPSVLSRIIELENGQLVDIKLILALKDGSNDKGQMTNKLDHADVSLSCATQFGASPDQTKEEKIIPSNQSQSAIQHRLSPLSYFESEKDLKISKRDQTFGSCHNEKETNVVQCSHCKEKDGNLSTPIIQSSSQHTTAQIDRQTENISTNLSQSSTNKSPQEHHKSNNYIHCNENKRSSLTDLRHSPVQSGHPSRNEKGSTNSQCSTSNQSDETVSTSQGLTTNQDQTSFCTDTTLTHIPRKKGINIKLINQKQKCNVQLSEQKVKALTESTNNNCYNRITKEGCSKFSPSTLEQNFTSKNDAKNDRQSETGTVFQCLDCRSDFSLSSPADLEEVCSHVAVGIAGGSAANFSAFFRHFRFRVKLIIKPTVAQLPTGDFRQTMVSAETVVSCIKCPKIEFRMDENCIRNMSRHMENCSGGNHQNFNFCIYCDQRVSNLDLHFKDFSEIHLKRLKSMATCFCSKFFAVCQGKTPTTCKVCKNLTKTSDPRLPHWLSSSTCDTCILKIARQTKNRGAETSEIVFCNFCQQGKFGYNFSSSLKSSCASICVNCSEIFVAFETLQTRQECLNYVKGMLNELVTQLKSDSPMSNLNSNQSSIQASATSAKKIAVVTPEPRQLAKRHFSKQSNEMSKQRKTEGEMFSTMKEALNDILERRNPDLTIEKSEIFSYEDNQKSSIISTSDVISKLNPSLFRVECLECSEGWNLNRENSKSIFLRHYLQEENAVNFFHRSQLVLSCKKTTDKNSENKIVCISSVYQCKSCQLFMNGSSSSNLLKHAQTCFKETINCSPHEFSHSCKKTVSFSICNICRTSQPNLTLINVEPGFVVCQDCELKCANLKPVNHAMKPHPCTRCGTKKRCKGDVWMGSEPISFCPTCWDNFMTAKQRLNHIFETFLVKLIEMTNTRD